MVAFILSTVISYDRDNDKGSRYEYYPYFAYTDFFTPMYNLYDNNFEVINIDDMIPRNGDRMYLLKHSFEGEDIYFMIYYLESSGKCVFKTLDTGLKVTHTMPTNEEIKEFI